jgi:hypothetical protein
MKGQCMQIFTTRVFSRLAVANELGDADLITAVAEMNDGLWDVNLGGQVYKKRVALAGRGKSGGARTLVAFKSNYRAFFMYGFSKNQRSNITTREKQALKLMARELLEYSDKQLSQALNHGALIKIEVSEDD